MNNYCQQFDKYTEIISILRKPINFSSMVIEDELSKGQRTQRKIIRCYNAIINEYGVEALYTSKMRLYERVAERCNRSESLVRQTLALYFHGKIRL